MKFLGRYLNDLLEIQGDGRPMEDGRIYVAVDGGKLIQIEQ